MREALIHSGGEVTRGLATDRRGHSLMVSVLFSDLHPLRRLVTRPGVLAVSRAREAGGHRAGSRTQGRSEVSEVRLRSRENRGVTGDKLLHRARKDSVRNIHIFHSVPDQLQISLVSIEYLTDNLSKFL